MNANFNIYEQDKFLAQLSWVWKKFYNLGPGLTNVGGTQQDCSLEQTKHLFELKN